MNRWLNLAGYRQGMIRLITSCAHRLYGRMMRERSVVPPEKVGMIETAVVFSVPEYQVPPNTGFHLARLVAAGSVQDLNKLALIQ